MFNENENEVHIGVVACDIMRRELDALIERMPQIAEVVYLEVALHCHPEKMRKAIKEQIELIKEKVDAVFLGYGYCQSLKGIEDEFAIPIVMPQMDGCIQILMTPQKYASEMRKEAGTWFTTPGWAEAGAQMVLKETRCDRVVKYGKDPLEMAKRLFTHYKRCLFVDTHVGDTEHCLDRAREFCDIFNLRLDTTEGTSQILEQHLGMTLEVAVRNKMKVRNTTPVKSKS